MSTSKSSKQLLSKDKVALANISKYFEDNPGTNGKTFIQRTMEATGASRRTLFRVRRELRQTGTLGSPQRSKRGPYKPIDGFDENVMRAKVREFYAHRRQLPTVKKLHSVLQAEISYPGSRELLRTTLHKMGFCWKQTVDNRKVLIEKPQIVAQRMAFYARKKELEDKGYKLVFVDETWIDTAYTVKKCWQSLEDPGVIHPCNRGQRLIVVHAGSRNGFVKGALLVYKASSLTGDYHQEMNGQNYQKWIQEKLLPNLHDRSAVVMDNASYHSMQSDKCPTSSTRKDDIKEWLRNHNISFDDNLLKPQLLQLVRLYKPAPSFVIDNIIRSHGHEVLRLPPYHPEFNAIELIWSQLKSIVRHRNLTFRLDDTFKLTNAAFNEIGDERWRGACEHVDKAIERMKTADHYMADNTTRIVINLDDDTTDSDGGSSTDTASERGDSETDTASETGF